ncbi:ROK family transcriptional regulator [Litorihabitans aurantiacus]|uniref:ROK family transcriptional regulator n=1 Tax=Litorihabitans aurantiacus TaxID=1930061 RepID=UPI0024E157BC|nr:ROK family transcriptional regulator [Litorihabitans aurantiacus]
MPAGPKVALDAMPRTARAILRRILVHGEASRTELASTYELTLASLTRLTKPLVDEGLVAEGSARRTAHQGRPRLPLDVRAGDHLVVGVKLTGRDLFAVLTDLRATVLAERQVALTDTEPAAVVREIGAAVRGFGADPGALRGIGVSLGGHARDRATVVRGPFLGWEDVDLAPMLTRETGLPAVVDNDVVALTEALHWFGSARGRSSFAVVTIGAGIGYALVVHDRIVRSAAADLGGSATTSWTRVVRSSPARREVQPRRTCPRRRSPAPRPRSPARTWTPTRCCAVPRRATRRVSPS